MLKILAILSILTSAPAIAASVQPVTTVKITGGNELLKATVDTVNGKNRLAVDATQGTSPWVTSRNWNLGFSADSVTSRLQDGSGIAIGSVSDALKVNVTNSFAAGVPDKTTFTYGTTIQNEIGGVYQDSSPSVTAGQGAAVRITQFRALHLNLRDSSGIELGTSGNPVRIDPTGTTIQPVSQSTPNSAANAWPIKLTDGTNITAVKAASTAAIASDPSAVVALSPNSPVPAGSNNIGSLTNITGTVSLPTGAATQTTLASVDTKLTTTNSSLSSIDAGIPTSLGQTTMSNSMPVTIASDQTKTALKYGYTGTTIRLDDMNASNGGVARGTGITSTTVYTTIYSYTGQGTLFSFLVTFQGNLIGADVFDIRLVIDGTNVFTISTDDIGTNTLYNLTTDGDENTMGMSMNTNVFRYAAPRNFGITYSSSIQIQIKKASSPASKKFLAGLVYLTKG